VTLSNNVRSIIAEDGEMGFITRNGALLREDNDIIMKFTSKRSPESQRIRSRNYTTPITCNPVPEKTPKFIHIRNAKKDHEGQQ
jgi:hypothetical protein